MKYRKKPVVIDAWRVPVADDRSNEASIANAAEEAETLVHHDLGSPEGMYVCLETIDHEGSYGGIEIDTLEGVMRADPGDWIIRGVKGEFYPCKSEIFEATYDEVRGDDEGAAP